MPGDARGGLALHLRAVREVPLRRQAAEQQEEPAAASKALVRRASAEVRL